jgi:hypothetical protein
VLIGPINASRFLSDYAMCGLPFFFGRCFGYDIHNLFGVVFRAMVMAFFVPLRGNTALAGKGCHNHSPSAGCLSHSKQISTNFSLTSIVMPPPNQ